MNGGTLDSKARRFARTLACEQAHLFGVSREYLGGGATICEPAKPARSPILLAGSQIAAPPRRYSRETPNK